MDDRKIIILNVLIHGFAVAHAATAAALSQTLGGDGALTKQKVSGLCADIVSITRGDSK